MSRVGIVAIGRNEGERLIRCLKSVIGNDATVVYVDSGSTDGSIAAAQSLGVHVVTLDLSIPFTAARARNTGFDRLLSMEPNLEYVQFVDGDCEVATGWLEHAVEVLVKDPRTAVVCGRRREQNPCSSLYNMLADLEWDSPIGEAKACGGDAMMRAMALRAVGGFNPTLIAGEEPELCVRLRKEGWKIQRIDAEMTRHDMAMTRFSQWWKRSKRAGHAYAEGAFLHGNTPERHWVRESVGIWLWGFVLPVVAIGLAWPTRGLSLLLLLLLYLLSGYRAARWKYRQGRKMLDSGLYGMFCVLAKFPMLQGQIAFLLRKLRGRPRALIEYK